MCGIAGYVGDAFRDDAGLLGRMLDAIAHRGPDGRGVHEAPGVGLGHVRLSILDLAGGGQPMASDDGSLRLVFNGEIFNYVELRAELTRLGHRFRTRSDTEVLLRAYEAFGDDCVSRFNGQWAFALWDARRRRLFLSRDRLGVRPLFLAPCLGGWLFGSEAKALFACRALPRRLDRFGLAEVLTLWTTVPPRTTFEGVQELPPGHSAVVESGRLRTWAHWRLAYPPAEAPGSLEAAGEELAALLDDATRLRLRCDVPVGTYLSGGLDSAFTTALAKASDASVVRSFSVAFDDPEFDESAYQREVAQFLGTEHETVRFGAETIARDFPDVVRHAEKPLVRTAPAPLFRLAARVRERGFKVVVTGEGADETLGGYDLFKEDKVRRFMGRAPESRRRTALLRRLYGYLPRVHGQPEESLRQFFRPRPPALDDWDGSHQPRWDLAAPLSALLSPETRRTLDGYDPRSAIRAELPDDFRAWSPFCRAQYLETRYLLPGYILSSQGDRMAMAHGVEGRFPFLDHRVVEFAARLPPRWKMCGLDEKFLLKRIAVGRVPESVRTRSKQPYRAPDATSFFGVPERPQRWDYVETLLAPERLRATGLFVPEGVGRLVAKARAGQLRSTRDNLALVVVLSTQLLCDQLAVS